MKKEPFEKIDWYRGNEAFGDYANYYDNILDPRVKDVSLIKFICKLPLTRINRRQLIKVIKSPLD